MISHIGVVGLKAGSKEREKERQTVEQTEEEKTTGTGNREDEPEKFRGLAKIVDYARNNNPIDLSRFALINRRRRS